VRIWVDLVNSPQVLTLTPIMRELERRGHRLLVTTRDFAQTLQLADRVGLRHRPIGRHGGGSRLQAARVNLERVFGVAWMMRRQRVDLALSHNSYSQAVAAQLLGVPFVTMMDYEHQPLNHLCFRLARRVIVPEPFPAEDLARFGASGKAVRFAGTKEQVYLSDFEPHHHFLRDEGIPENRIVVAMRPPAPWAPYHRFENTLFDEVLATIAANPETFIVFTPRVPAQGEAILRLGYDNVWVPPRVLDGPNLLYHADLALSGGGTMNREAAVLGTPAYTVFKGKLGAVDRYLIERGRMVQVGEQADIASIRIEKRADRGGASQTADLHDRSLIGFIADAILAGAK
jgi:predicted glycosyltransferase